MVSLLVGRLRCLQSLVERGQILKTPSSTPSVVRSLVIYQLVMPYRENFFAFLLRKHKVGACKS